MIYSKTTSYAIRALGFMASQPPDQPVDIRLIAKKCRISPTYLAKIFQVLSRAGIVISQRGAGGGFIFRKDPSTISLLTIIQTTDNPKQSLLFNCVMGLDQCSDKNPCLVHPDWLKLTRQVKEKFSRSTVKDLSVRLANQKFSVGKGSVLSRRMKAVFSV